MATPSKRSKRSAHAAGTSPSVPPETAAEAPVEDQEVTLIEPRQAEEHESASAVEKAPAAPVTQELPVLPLLPSPIESKGQEFVAEGEATLIQRSPSRPRKTTLAMAITKSVPLSADPAASRESAESGPLVNSGEFSTLRAGEVDEVADELDEWSIADQPTVYLSPQLLTQPPRPVGPSTEVVSAPARIPRSPAAPPQWLASTDDEPWPARHHQPPQSMQEKARANPPADEHLERFQRLREGRMAHQEGERAPGEGRQVADIVRQWWRDLRPGLTSALSYQREARASGVHPIPAHEPLPASASRLGDAFGRFAASARGMTGRAQSVMTPRLNRLQELHAQAESAASALVQKMEGPLARQQAPLLGPGRIAVFFKSGVTVGQAQSLLGASRARPIRLIPRKHGFLALVPPGAEAEICERLREHPYIRDVAYVEYDEYGDPIRPSAPPR